MPRPLKCTPEVLRKALRLINEEGKTLTRAAMELGVDPASLSRKLREYGYRPRTIWVKVKPEELRLFDEEEG